MKKKDNVIQFGTESRKIRRNDHPDTSFEAAATTDTGKYEQLAYEIITRHGINGCILDDVRQGFREAGAPRSAVYSVPSRITGLHQKGLVLDTGARKRGESGRRQAWYVATEFLSPEQIEWIKNQPLAKNDCLFTDENEGT